MLMAFFLETSMQVIMDSFVESLLHCIGDKPVEGQGSVSAQSAKS